jgi:DNA-binding transcriptional LysR family regulator
MIVLTPDGEQFARDIRPVLEALTRSREKNPGHAP